MEPRPKLQLSPSPFDKCLNIAATCVFVALLASSAFVFLQLPATTPLHFNAAGHPDGYGNKAILLILPAIATLMYFGLRRLVTYPHLFNYLTKITSANAQKQYTIATRMVRFLLLSVLIVFILIILFTYFTAVGMANGPGPWFIFLVFGLLFIPTIVFIAQSLQSKNTAP